MLEQNGPHSSCISETRDCKTRGYKQAFELL